MLIPIVLALPIVFMSGNFVAYARENLFKLATVYPHLLGTVMKIESGTDSVGLWIKAPGKLASFLILPSTDGLPPQYKNGPPHIPSIVDVGSQVDITHSGRQLLDYKVIKRASHLWISIAASQAGTTSEGPSSHMQDLKYALYQQGCMSDVLYSSHFQALRPGYWIVASGGFTNPGEAESCKNKAKNIGIPDAYIRQLW